jgi:hypothetical protein
MLSELKGFSPYHHATYRSSKRAHACIQGETWSNDFTNSSSRENWQSARSQYVAKIMQQFHCWIGPLDGMDEVENT